MRDISTAKIIAAAKALHYSRFPDVPWRNVRGDAQWKLMWRALAALRAAEKEA